MMNLLDTLPHLVQTIGMLSLQATVLAGLLLVISKTLRNRITPEWMYLLWFVLVLRLIVPWSIPVSWQYNVPEVSQVSTTSVQ